MAFGDKFDLPLINKSQMQINSSSSSRATTTEITTTRTTTEIKMKTK